MLLGSAMKRMLVGNDNWGNPTMRNIILDESNKVNRFFNHRLDQLCNTLQSSGDSTPKE